ncbi:MAG: hypothetical protein DRP71_03930 [Verrucomicrobia bacterium]|nr:MAG: hypothetical protein DRP71_03930 [Verrucomicrobiota bacterium]
MGKSSKKRDCPAINQTISRADCGQNRHTRYPCPAECPHNPLAPAILVAHFLSSLGDAIKDKSFAPTAAIYVTAIVTTVMDEIDRVIRG